MIRRHRGWNVVAAALAVAAGLTLSISPIFAGFRISAVGGVVVDPQGVLKAPDVDATKHLVELRAAQLKKLPADISKAGMRKISLKRLIAAIQDRKSRGEMDLLTDEMVYMAGMTRLQYVFVYPEENDIVLVGPGEALKLTAAGDMVGAESGRPALRLEQFLTGLRTAEKAAQQPITCSIDPTKEGIAAVQAYLGTQKQFTAQTAANVEKALGLQNITISGVDANSDFARTMVAADYRMKRLAMNMDEAPVSGLPSYLSMLSGGSTGVQSMTPRWWLAPNYEAVVRDADGLAWELKGQGVKCMTEDSLISATGDVQSKTGKTSAKAQRWADLMTERYDELSTKVAVFGELRNIMDMAVISALIVKEDLPAKAHCDIAALLDKDLVTLMDLGVPQKVDSKASVVKAGSKFIISASGGVEINSWGVLENVKENKDMATLRQKNAHEGMHWWWN